MATTIIPGIGSECHLTLHFKLYTPVNPEAGVAHPWDQAVSTFDAQSPLVVPEITQDYQLLVVLITMDQMPRILILHPKHSMTQQLQRLST